MWSRRGGSKLDFCSDGDKSKMNVHRFTSLSLFTALPHLNCSSKVHQHIHIQHLQRCSAQGNICTANGGIITTCWSDVNGP